MDRRTFLAMLAASAAAAACPRRQGAAAPRLALLYATCSLDAGHLGPYRSGVEYTPNLDRFADGARVFERHQTEAGQSGIAYASLFTGLQADGHHVFDHPRILRDELRLVTEVFADAGWEVYFWGGHGMASYDLGYGQGVPPENHRPRWLTADDPLFVEVVERVREDPGARVLVVTNFTVTHMKYTANPAYFDPTWRSPDTLPAEFARTGLTRDELEEYRRLFFDEASDFELCGALSGTLDRWGLDAAEGERFVTAVEYLYRCAVARLDRAFGAVVDRLESAGVLDDAVVVFTADHGEVLSRPGSFFTFAHGFQLAPEVLRVPLLIRAPAAGVAPGAWSSVTRSVDVMPTLAGLCGVPAPRPPEVEGVDLAPALVGSGPVPALRAFSHTSLVPSAILEDPAYHGSVLERLHPARDPELMWVAVRDGDLVAKLARREVDGPIEPALYDLAADPWERHDLLDLSLDSHRQLVSELGTYKARLAAVCRRALARQPRLLEGERRKRLRALGYLE